MEIGQGGVDDLLLDEAAGGGEAAVEVEGGDDGFEGVGEEGGLAAATALLFAAAEDGCGRRGRCGAATLPR